LAGCQFEAVGVVIPELVEYGLGQQVGLDSCPECRCVERARRLPVGSYAVGSLGLLGLLENRLRCVRCRRRCCFCFFFLSLSLSLSLSLGRLEDGFIYP